MPTTKTITDLAPYAGKGSIIMSAAPAPASQGGHPWRHGKQFSPEEDKFLVNAIVSWYDAEKGWTACFDRIAKHNKIGSGRRALNWQSRYSYGDAGKELQQKVADKCKAKGKPVPVLVKRARKSITSNEAPPTPQPAPRNFSEPQAGPSSGRKPVKVVVKREAPLELDSEDDAPAPVPSRPPSRPTGPPAKRPRPSASKSEGHISLQATLDMLVHLCDGTVNADDLPDKFCIDLQRTGVLDADVLRSLAPDEAIDLFVACGVVAPTARRLVAELRLKEVARLPAGPRSLSATLRALHPMLGSDALVDALAKHEIWSPKDLARSSAGKLDGVCRGAQGIKVVQRVVLINRVAALR